MNIWPARVWTGSTRWHARERWKRIEVTGNVPNLIITMPDMKEETFGYMCYFFFKACAVSVYLLTSIRSISRVFEVYKKNMFRLLGKN